MKPRWIVEDNILKIKDGDTVIHIPNSHEIYGCLNSDVEVVSSDLFRNMNTITEDLPELTVSKLSVSAYMKIYVADGKIAYKIYVTKTGKEYEVKTLCNGGSDAIIIGNRLHFIDGSFNAIEDVLADAEVNNDKIISFSSYVKLLEVVKETSGVRIVDEVKNNLKNLSAENGFGEESDEDLKATLYTYQELGLKWLNYITNENCGCILGDEMGLGKTMQIIALFLKHNSLKMSPYLVVAPVSLLENWKRELNKFAPSLKVCVHYGSKRSGFYKHLLDCDVVITAYSTIATDVSMFNMVTWDIMVLDEAQNIKNQPL